MDHAAWLNQDTGEEAQKAYNYFMRPDPEQREFTGPIQEETDALTGTVAMFREGKVGMVRGAKEEDMKNVKVYLGFDGVKSLPHIRLEKGKPLQGWYQSAENDKQGSRPRPCYTEAILTEPYGGYCTVGCAFSLPAGEAIDTPRGPRQIQDIRKGELVWGRTDQGTVLAMVTGVTQHWKPEGYVVLELSDGRILRLTADHPIYSADRKTWVEAGNLHEGESLEDLQEGRSVAEGRIRAHDGQQQRPAQTTASLQHVRSSYPYALPQSMRWLSTSRTDSRKVHAVQHRTFTIEGQTQIRGDSAQDARISAPPKREHGLTCVGTEDSQMAIDPSGARPIRDFRISLEQAFRIHGSKGTDTSNAKRLGSAAGRLVGQQVDELGLRARESQSSERESLHTRLQAFGRSIPGSEGVRKRNQPHESGSSKSYGSSRHSFGKAQFRASGRPTVKTITRVEGGLQVHDIETTTENFYHNGILSHNCYVNSGFRGYRGSGLISVPVNYGAQVRQMLSKTKTSAAGYFSSFTDPFLPLEDVYHNTQNGAMEFVRLGLPVFFLSRMSYPGWAFDLLQQNKYSYAQKSINTPDPEDWKKLSPGALSLMEHLDEIRELSRRGIYVSIQVNPIIAGVTTHDDIERLLEMLKEAGANHVIFKFVEAGYSWAPAMVERIMRRFGDNRGAAFRDLFVENSAGSQKTVIEEYRREGFRRYQAKANALGLTMALCYEYAKDDLGKWRSIGGDYMTSDQCHGQRVPMFTRSSTQSPTGKPVAFREVEACPPSGCLTCASDNDGAARCGNEERGKAKAMRAPDYKESVL